MKFVVYSKDHCPFCDKAKMLITMKGHDLEEKKLDVDFSREDLMSLFPNARTFPQVVLEDSNTHIGGCDDLVNWFDLNAMDL